MTWGRARDVDARAYGMQPQHAHRLRGFVQGRFRAKRLLVVIRAAKEWKRQRNRDELCGAEPDGLRRL